MRSAIFAFALGLVCISSAGAVSPLPFSITCKQMEVGAGKSVYEPIGFQWDGAVLLSLSKNLSGAMEKSEEQVISSKNLETGIQGGMHLSFHTGVHSLRRYKYNTALRITPQDSNLGLEVMFATIDVDGFLVSASSIAYRECRLR